jgi:DNA-binding MarR family transcriptional regulator
MGSPHLDACKAWQLLVKFFFAQREHMPVGGGALDLSPAQCYVLHLLDPEDPVPMGRLAETLSCDASNVTGLVDRLETRGLVQRRPSSYDRRVRVIALTRAGARTRAELQDQIAGGACALRKLSPADRRTLVRLLETLLADGRA